MARHSLMDGVRATISTMSRTAVVLDKLSEVAEVSVDAWIAELEQERRQLAAELAAAQQQPNP